MSDTWWRQATEIREEWLGWALTTRPADRMAAEAAITELYRLLDEDPPTFVWVKSPAAASYAVPYQKPLPGLRVREATLPESRTGWPLASRLASMVSDLRCRLDARLRRTGAQSWRPRAESGPADLGEVISAAVEGPLRATVRDSLCIPLRLALEPVVGHVNDLAWHGQHDAHWVGLYDAWRRITPVRFAPALDAQLDLWATLARSCSWWWPRDNLCVLSERPAEIHVEPANEGVRLHGGPALRFPDGWSMHAWHGTRVPSWVITNPTVERIAAEPNVEVRRCAVERIGWDAYISRAGLQLVGTRPDPGNPGAELRLYDLPDRLWGGPARILLTVNGSVERDGRRRRYGLTVPADLDDPLAAAGWTYGLSGPQYAQLSRRT